jgi:hypothetical protein
LIRNIAGQIYEATASNNSTDKKVSLQALEENSSAIQKWGNLPNHDTKSESIKEIKYKSYYVKKEKKWSGRRHQK